MEGKRIITKIPRQNKPLLTGPLDLAGLYTCMELVAKGVNWNSCARAILDTATVITLTILFFLAF